MWWWLAKILYRRGFARKVLIIHWYSRKFQTPSSIRIPNCFLLIGGIIAVLSVLGLLLVKEPEKGQKTENTEQKQLDDSELPSLDAKEVLRTALFYKVALSANNWGQSTFSYFRFGLPSSQFVGQWYSFKISISFQSYSEFLPSEPSCNVAKVFWFENDWFWSFSCGYWHSFKLL